MSYEAIILAAGKSERMKCDTNKIQLELLGKPILAYTLAPFMRDSLCQHIIIVSKAEEKHCLQEIVQKYFPETTKRITYAVGSQTRQASAHCGLQALEDPTRFVLIHDGARPCITLELVRSVYERACQTKAAIAGVPAKDTIKEVINDKIQQTLNRANIWQIQTPQAFIGTELQLAYRKAEEAGFLGTDDSAIMEKFGEREVEVVFGDYQNIKLTTPEDLLLAEAILANRKKNSD